ncbi:MAG: galactokinase [Chloroherpetonaceae bacterium]|nr:galactokinase [Chloroherpetonaceae bacterium]
MNESMMNQVAAKFHAKFGKPPEFIARAPGRVNLIGEHTDYNNGFVMPMALSNAVWIACRRVSYPIITFYSTYFDETKGFSLKNIFKETHSWLEYAKGAAWALLSGEDGKISHVPKSGLECLIDTDLPMSAGLSSSAALEVALARAFTEAFQLVWEPTHAARLMQKAENEWIGMRCGIMDMLISTSAQKGSALLIDCQDFSMRPAPLPSGTSIIILDTGTRRALSESRYNTRREECEAAAKALQLSSLRDATFEMIEQKKLKSELKKRAIHVVSENLRVLKAEEAMKQNDPKCLGKLWIESHQSLKNDFEVSAEVLDTMVKLASEDEACYGARMTGAGFGGCAVALVQSEAAETFCKKLKVRYERAMPVTCTIFEAKSECGAELFQHNTLAL